MLTLASIALFAAFGGGVLELIFFLVGCNVSDSFNSLTALNWMSPDFGTPHPAGNSTSIMGVLPYLML